MPSPPRSPDGPSGPPNPTAVPPHIATPDPSSTPSASGAARTWLAALAAVAAFGHRLCRDCFVAGRRIEHYDAAAPAWTQPAVATTTAGTTRLAVCATKTTSPWLPVARYPCSSVSAGLARFTGPSFRAILARVVDRDRWTYHSSGSQLNQSRRLARLAGRPYLVAGTEGPDARRFADLDDVGVELERWPLVTSRNRRARFAEQRPRAARRAESRP